MSGQKYTVAVSEKSRWKSTSTLHLIGCPVLSRARYVKPERLKGWIASDGRAIDRTSRFVDTPARVGVDRAKDLGLTESFEDGWVGEVAWAAAHAEQAEAGHHYYRVCRRCNPDPLKEKS